MHLARVRNFLEVHDDTGLVGQNGILGGILYESVPSRGIGQKSGHLLNAPDIAVVVIEHAHHGQFDRGIERSHPLVKLVASQERDGFRGGRFHRTSLVVGVIHDGDRPIGSYAMQLFGDEQVDVFVMLFQ